MGDAYKQAYHLLATAQRSDPGNTPNTGSLPSGFKRTSKYEVGDSVWSKNGNVEYEVVEACGLNAWGTPEYLLRDVMSKVELYYSENALISEPYETSVQPESASSGCECGTEKTYGKNAPGWMHSSWCNKYRSEK